MNPRNFFAELKRRNVYKVAVAYAVVGWLLIQVATQTFPLFEIPNWAVRLVVLAIIIGFPIALVLAWAFELTPDGIQRAADAGAVRKSPRRGWIALVAIAAIARIFTTSKSSWCGARLPSASAGRMWQIGSIHCLNAFYYRRLGKAGCRVIDYRNSWDALPRTLRHFIDSSRTPLKVDKVAGVPASVFALACIKHVSPLPSEFWRGQLFPKADDEQKPA